MEKRISRWILMALLILFAIGYQLFSDARTPRECSKWVCPELPSERPKPVCPEMDRYERCP